MAGTSIILTTAKPGSGKSYRRCAGAIPEILDDGFERHISNFPVRFDDNADGEGMRAACERLVRIREEGQGGKVVFRPIRAEEVEKKILRIPQEILDKWAVHNPGTSEQGDGPWNYFEGPELDRAHIAIDEAQLYCPKTGCQAAKKQAWATWLSEIRHRGARIEFITQDPLLLADEITKLAGSRIEIFTRDDEWLGILGCHFRALRYFMCKLIGRRIIFAVEVEYTGTTSSKWEEVRRFMFTINGAMFGRYDSHSKPKTGVAGKEVDEPWQRYGWVGLVAWFFRTYFVWQVRNVICAAAFIWLCFCGGLGQVASFGIHGMTAVTKSMLDANKLAAVDVGDKQGAQAGASHSGGAVADRPPRSGAAVGGSASLDGSAWRLAGLTPRAAYFDGYGWCEIGEVIGDDVLNDVRLESIDWHRSRAVLSDGRVLRLFTPVGPGGAGSPVPGGVSSGGGVAAPGAGSGGGVGTASDAERGQHESERSGTVAGKRTFGVDNFRGGVAGQGGND